MNGTTRFAPYAKAPRRWSPGLAVVAVTLLSWLVSLHLPY